jgi:hypothetical protein
MQKSIFSKKFFTLQQTYTMDEEDIGNRFKKVLG